jgi:hypothetical protein
VPDNIATAIPGMNSCTESSVLRTLQSVPARSAGYNGGRDHKQPVPKEQKQVGITKPEEPIEGLGDKTITDTATRN